MVSTDRLELTTSLSKAILKYENILIMGDFNMDVKNKSLGYDKIDEFRDVYNLTDLIKISYLLDKKS